MIQFNNSTFNIYLGIIEPTIYLGTEKVYPSDGLKWIHFNEGDNSPSCEVKGIRIDTEQIDQSWFDDRYMQFIADDGQFESVLKFILTSNGEYELYDATQDTTETLEPDENWMIEYLFPDGVTVHCDSPQTDFDMSLLTYEVCDGSIGDGTDIDEGSGHGFDSPD